MPRDGAIIFGDLIGKLDMLRVECPKCGRVGQYRLADLLMRYGRAEKLLALRKMLRRIAPASRRAATMILETRTSDCPLIIGHHFPSAQ
jgi:hypothetical protein